MAPSVVVANLVSVSGCKDRDNFFFSKQNGRKMTNFLGPPSGGSRAGLTTWLASSGLSVLPVRDVRQSELSVSVGRRASVFVLWSG